MRSHSRAVRLLNFLPRVALAGLCGAVLRTVRRLLGKGPRIWHGTNALHLIQWLVAVDRQAGFTSRSVIAQVTRSSYALFSAGDFDVVLEERGIPADEQHWVGLVDLLLRGDVWVASFDSQFFPTSQRRANRWVLRLIKAVGIRIIMAPHGGDVTYLDNRTTRFHWVERAQTDYPAWDLAAQKEVNLWRTNLFCEFADFVISSDSPIDRFLPRRDAAFKWLAVDTSLLRPPVDPPANPTPLIVHAPNHRNAKGTGELVAAFDRLKRLGLDAELRLVERVPRDAAFQIYREADIIADQFCVGAFGMFALEGLALGKVVLTYLDQEQLGDPVFNLPLVNTNPENLAMVLAALIESPELRKRIGHASREAVEKYHSIPAMAEVWRKLHWHVWTGQPLRLESTTHFNSERRPRSFSEDPRDTEFWPVPVDDLIDGIRARLAKLFTRDDPR